MRARAEEQQEQQRLEQQEEERPEVAAGAGSASSASAKTATAVLMFSGGPHLVLSLLARSAAATLASHLLFACFGGVCGFGSWVVRAFGLRERGQLWAKV